MSAAPRDPMNLHGLAGQPSRTDCLLDAVLGKDRAPGTYEQNTEALARLRGNRVVRALLDDLDRHTRNLPESRASVAALSYAIDVWQIVACDHLTLDMDIEDRARLLIETIRDRGDAALDAVDPVIDALADTIGISDDFVAARPPFAGPTTSPCVCKDGELEWIGDGDNNDWSCGHCGLHRACEPIDREDDA